MPVSTENGHAKKPRALAALVIAIGIVLVCAVAGISICKSVRNSIVADGAAAIQESILDAAEQCYAIEGAYPPSLEYLAKHYGIRVNEQSYSVTYSVFASNIQPVVMVKIK